MYFDEKEIDNLRQVYNKEHANERPIPKGGVDKVWKTIQHRLQEKCDDGAAECIITSLIAKPKAPSSWRTNPEEWLSSLDIDELEHKFQQVFKQYYYVGTVPIDFGKHSKTGQCLVNSLCSLDIRNIYKKGYRQIGIVFNTDVSTGPGKHWIALFCDIRPELEYPRITYFDSYAYKPEKEIQVLMKTWKEEWDSTHIHSKPMEVSYNKTRHQYEDSECGMYSLYFHLCCLMGIPMKDKVPDKVVRGFRSLLFKV
jgi:hypothetical protein